MLWIWNIIVGLLVSVMLAGIMIPQILLISFRKKLFDEPDPRKIHTAAIPRLGGLAFTPVIFVTIALLMGVELVMGYDEILNSLIANALTVTFCFCALFVVYIVGIADDLIGVRYRAKFVIQIICAVMLIAGGLSINEFHGFLWVHQMPDWVAWCFTILISVFIINALNLIDGIDGLASGLSSVAFVFYGYYFFIAGEYLYALVAVATLGVLAPFFYYNVFGNPLKRKKIFMGDTGSLTIGLILCILSFKILRTPSPESDESVSMLIVAVSPLIIPCFDVLRVFFGRIIRHTDPFLPDKTHVHHKLLALGMKPRTAMLTILLASVLFIVVNNMLSRCLNVNLILLLDAVIWTSIMLMLPKSQG